MARIEFDNVEQKMEDLKSYSPYSNQEDNLYASDELTDDEFNFISGFNYALSRVTDLFIANRDCAESLTSDIETLDNFLGEITEKVIKEYAQYGYIELEELMTCFIESHD